MVEFNIRETGNELLEILEGTLGPENPCRLTVDVLIPENLFGDKSGLCQSIITICKFLDTNITRLIVDIELLRIGYIMEPIQLHIEVKGSDSNPDLWEPFLVLSPDGIERLIRSLPYLTTCTKSDISIRFSFKMTFEYSKERKRTDRIFENRAILLAEDSDLSALVFAAFTEEWGCNVIRVPNGRLAIEKARETHFDIIFIDVHMPGMSGNEAIRKIREFDRHVPIIAVATTSMQHASTFAKEAGANNVITKPVESAELKKILIHYLDIRI